MCDPLSTTASILALAGVAAKSCECLYNALRLFSEAPKDLQHHINAVQALQSIFTDIAALEKDLPNAALITPDFKARLQACMLDLQAVERLAKSFCARLEEGRARRTWAKMRWSSADQRQALKRYLSRIESYHKIFSLDLLLLNMWVWTKSPKGILRTINDLWSTSRLSLPPTKESLSNQEEYLHPPDVSVERSLRLHGHNYSLPSPQEYFPNQVSLRSSFLRCLESDPLRFLLWLGPITVQQWHNSWSLDSNGLKSGHGYGIALATASQFYCPFRFELMVSLMRNWKGPGVNFSIHWNLFCPRIVPWNASIVDLALRGDVDAMKGEFSTRHSTPFDVLPGGLTLLHVCFRHCLQQAPADTKLACCVAGSFWHGQISSPRRRQGERNERFWGVSMQISLTLYKDLSLHWPLFTELRYIRPSRSPRITTFPESSSKMAETYTIETLTAKPLCTPSQAKSPSRYCDVMDISSTSPPAIIVVWLCFITWPGPARLPTKPSGDIMSVALFA